MHAKACKTKGGPGAWSPRKILCFEIASEVVLGQKQSNSSYMAHGVLHLGYPADFEFPREKVLRLAKQQVG